MTTSWRPVDEPRWDSPHLGDLKDPLRILRSTAAVMRTATDVAIDASAVRETAGTLLRRTAAPEWDVDLHYREVGPGGDERTAMWILVLDALNFCFWGQGSDPSVRWRVEWRGKLVDGYVALVGALTKAVQDGMPIHHAPFLANIDPDAVAAILAPAEGHPAIPLPEARVANLRELGRGLLDLGSEAPATTLINAAHGSAIALVRDVVRRFPSFNDVARWDRAPTSLADNEVRFYKRAQILVGDIAGGLAGSSLGEFSDLHRLTAFADYKVPQMLRQMGILRCSPDLAGIVERRMRVPAGSYPEIEIRAATIWGCELLRQELNALGREISPHELDWLLWTEAQALSGATHPYHLTPTIFY